MPQITTRYPQLFLYVKISFQFFNGGLHERIFFDSFLDRSGSMNHRGVIPSTKLVADRRKRGLGVFPT
jgi:hypothetical protein